MVNEMDGFCCWGAGGFWVAAFWGAGSGSGGVGTSAVDSVGGREGVDVLLAIARPTPAKIDSGSEASASQCNPVTQLNSASAT